MSRVARQAAAAACILFAGLFPSPTLTQSAGSSSRYEDLVALFADWRAFQKPRMVNGVPDYTADAMAAQAGELPHFQQRVAAIDASRWPIPQQVDWYVVRAEMNGLEFDHRVLRPWANNPAFYVTIFPSEAISPRAKARWRTAAWNCGATRFR